MDFDGMFLRAFVVTERFCQVKTAGAEHQGVNKLDYENVNFVRSSYNFLE